MSALMNGSIEAPSRDMTSPAAVPTTVGEWRDPAGFAAAVAALPFELRERVPVAAKRAAEKLADLAPNPRAGALFDAAVGARTARQRVVWLQRWGSAWAEPMARVAACRRGCAHCCHLQVAITSAEAKLIGDATGLAPSRPANAFHLKDAATESDLAQHWRQAEQRVAGAACPFLKDDECTLYEQRPFACRTHLSLDDDALLCQLIAGVKVPVPYADSRAVCGLFLAAQPAKVLADIREFFPQNLNRMPEHSETRR